MQAPGPAQIELIRRYARTLRHLQSQSLPPRSPRIGAREDRLRRQAARFVHTMDPHEPSGPTLPTA